MPSGYGNRQKWNFSLSARPVKLCRISLREGRDAYGVRSVRLAQPDRHGLLWSLADRNPELRPLRQAGGDVRFALRRQPALHARPARPPHGAAQLHAPQLGAARAVRQLVPRADARSRESIPTWSPTTCITSRTAARRITAASAPGTSSAGRNTTRGRRWSNRRLPGFARSFRRSITTWMTAGSDCSTRSTASSWRTSRTSACPAASPARSSSSRSTIAPTTGS